MNMAVCLCQTVEKGGEHETYENNGYDKKRSFKIIEAESFIQHNKNEQEIWNYKKRKAVEKNGIYVDEEGANKNYKCKSEIQKTEKEKGKSQQDYLGGSLFTKISE